MRPLPTPPAPGKPVSATLIRQIISAIRERTVFAGRGLSIKRGPNGTVLNTEVAASANAAAPSVQLHPWMVVGLNDSVGETGHFKIYSPGGQILGRKVFIGGRMVSVDGLTMRQGEGEDGDWWSFDGDDDITDEDSTLYIVVYLTPDTIGTTDESDDSEPSDDDDPIDYKFAAEMVLDPEAFAEESKVKAVYEIAPVATVRVETDEEGNEKGVVVSQRLNTDLIHAKEFYT